jgi:2-oxoglutarate ferredoxin oxidoreductase subunit alpha
MSDFGGVHRYNVTGLVHDMWGFPSDNPKVVHGLLRHLVDKIENNANQMARYKTFYLEDAETSWSATARRPARPCTSSKPAKKGRRSACWNCRRCGRSRRMWSGKYCDDAQYTVVVEMNMGQVCQMVKTTLRVRSGCFWPTASTGCSSRRRTSKTYCA